MPFYAFMSGLVDEVQATHTDENHLQNGILYKESGDHGCHRYQVITEMQALRLAGHHADKNVRHHGYDIAEVVADVSKTGETEVCHK